MQEFYSVSQFPGKTGTLVYNRFFRELGLENYSYLAIGSNDISSTIKLLAQRQHTAGISVSMPFKKDVIKYLDHTDNLVSKYQSCNTILVNNEKLSGYNTDYAGVEWVSSLVSTGDSVSILGSGCMATMVASTIKSANVVMYSRSLGNWDHRTRPVDVVINASAAGTVSKQSPFVKLPNGVKLVIDLAIKKNELQTQCISSNIPYVQGLDFYQHQFKLQFKLYTGVDLDIKHISKVMKELENEIT